MNTVVICFVLMLDPGVMMLHLQEMTKMTEWMKMDGMGWEAGKKEKERERGRKE